MCKQEENVVLISLGKLQPFPGHPFQVRDDQLMQQLVDSIRNVGVLVPAIVRKTDDGAYQLIGGHKPATCRTGSVSVLLNAATG